MEALRRRMTDVVTVASEGEPDEYGNTETLPARAIQARVEHRVKVTRNPNTGEELASSAQFMTFSPVLVTEQVWLPGRDTMERRESHNVIAVEHADSFSGHTLYRIWLT